MSAPAVGVSGVLLWSPGSDHMQTQGWAVSYRRALAAGQGFDKRLQDEALHLEQLARI